jgi:hypothetical protein
MLKTSSSRLTSSKGNPRHIHHETVVQESDPVSVAILNEINLLISARDSALQYIAFVSNSTEQSPESHRLARQELRELVRNIPSVGELKSESQSPHRQGPTTYYYKTRYAVYSLPCTDRISRPGVLTNVASLLDFMRTWRLPFRAALPDEHHTEHDRLFDSSIVMYNFGVGPRFAFVSASARAPK